MADSEHPAAPRAVAVLSIDSAREHFSRRREAGV